MNREQKAVVIQELKNDFSECQASFLVGYQGLTVNQLQQLRRKLREKHGRFKVAKARLMKKASDGVEGYDQMADFFKNQVGLVFAEKEPTAVAKVLYEFSKDNGALQLVAGYFDHQTLNNAQIVRIASLPSREVLLAQLAGMLKSPIAGMVYALHVVSTRGDKES
jgi:large subunit ribosomal protein L10